MKDRFDGNAEIGMKKPIDSWNFNWKPITRRVKNLRKRIFRATQAGNWRCVSCLMKLMLRSFSNLLLAIRRVTQLNQGKKTAGVDGFIAMTPEQRIELIQKVREFKPKDILPAKRVYISKPNGKFRPLGIPTVVCRVKQAIILNAWEPYFETSFDEHSYGFRPGRGTHDAIEQAFVRLRGGDIGDVWILDADIKGYFDNITHETILEKTNKLPGIEYVKGWLKAGYVSKEIFKKTMTGTPQGGIISPLLANIALDEIGKVIRQTSDKKEIIATRKGKKVRERKTIYPYGFIRYADDFIITAKTTEQIGAILPILEEFLNGIGLELNREKTKFVHIELGFDYLGFNIRQYNGKTIIKPEKAKILNKIQEIRDWLKKNINASPEAIINHLNPILRGTAEYYKTTCSKEVLGYLDCEVWKALYRWAKRRHPSKGRKWIAKQYFNYSGKARYLNRWDFIAKVKDRSGKEKTISLFKTASTPIRRHIKVAGTNSPDDPKLSKYWLDRAKKYGKTRFAKDSSMLKVADKQNHLCPVCGESLHNGEALHLHHINPISKGGDGQLNNLIWLHEACHKNIHSRKSKKEKPETAEDWGVTEA